MMGKAILSMGVDTVRNGDPPDAEIPQLFRQDPHHAWELFTQRYADVIFSYLRHLGFDYDETMDRFVYVCQKLCEQDFRRLKSVRYAGSYGDLTPWLRKVIKNLSINWVWSTEGRRRLLKPITRLPARQQRIFELYFWKGLCPSALCEQLQLEHQQTDLPEVLDALESLFSLLSQKKLWRLMSNLMRMRREMSLDDVDEETGIGMEPAEGGPNPEEALMEREEEERMNRALSNLDSQERLMIQFRYEEGMVVSEIAELLRASEKEVQSTLKGALQKVRRLLR